MGIFNFLKSQPLYVRYADGTHYTSKLNASYKSKSLSNALNHSVVANCINIRANYLSKFKFYLEENNGDKNFDNDLTRLINQPNFYQTKEDFLRQYIWFSDVYGWVYQKPFASYGFNSDSIYNLNPSKIDFSTYNKKWMIWKSKDKTDAKNISFTYDDNGNKDTLKISDVIPFYSIANGLEDNNHSQLTSPSILDSVLKQMTNVDMLADAENTLLQTNGREAIFKKDLSKPGQITSGLPIEKKDKDNILYKLANKYNLTKGSRTIVPDFPLEHLDMSMDVRKLNQTESYKNNIGLIVRAFGLSNELYNYLTTGATFENQEKAEVRFLQNTIQPIADNIAKSWQSYFKEEKPFKATCEHLPTMQIIEEQKADRVLKVSTALRNLTNSGLSIEQATNFLTDNGISINQDEN